MKDIRRDKRMNENVTRYKNIKSFNDKKTVLFTQPDPTPVISKLSALNTSNIESKKSVNTRTKFKYLIFYELFPFVIFIYILAVHVSRGKTV